MSQDDRIHKLERAIRQLAAQVAQKPVRLASGGRGKGEEKFRAARGQCVGAVEAEDETFLIDNLRPLAGGLDPSAGNAALQVPVLNVFGQAFADNELVDVFYSPFVRLTPPPIIHWETLPTGGFEDDDFRGVTAGTITAASGARNQPLTPGWGPVILYTMPAIGGVGAPWQPGPTVTAENWMRGTIDSFKPVLLRKSRKDTVLDNTLYTIVAEGCEEIPSGGE